MGKVSRKLGKVKVRGTKPKSDNMFKYYPIVDKLANSFQYRYNTIDQITETSRGYDITHLTDTVKNWVIKKASERISTKPRDWSVIVVLFGVSQGEASVTRITDNLKNMTAGEFDDKLPKLIEKRILKICEEDNSWLFTNYAVHIVPSITTISNLLVVEQELIDWLVDHEVDPFEPRNGSIVHTNKEFKNADSDVYQDIPLVSVDND